MGCHLSLVTCLSDVLTALCHSTWRRRLLAPTLPWQQLLLWPNFGLPSRALGLTLASSFHSIADRAIGNEPLSRGNGVLSRGDLRRHATPWSSTDQMRSILGMVLRQTPWRHYISIHPSCPNMHTLYLAEKTIIGTTEAHQYIVTLFKRSSLGKRNLPRGKDLIKT